MAERIVDMTLAVAGEVGWQNVRLRLVAKRLGVPLAAVAESFHDLDSIANAWFGRAWAAVLSPPPKGFVSLPAEERLHLVIMCWFDALADHRGVTGEMLAAKVYPSHPHHWVPAIFGLSRTIQWMRDAAILDAKGLRRQFEEVGLTAVFLATLAVWLRDDTPDQSRTRASLHRRLRGGDRATVAIWGKSMPPQASTTGRRKTSSS